MTWLIFALLGTALWAASNHLDKFLLNRYFPGGGEGSLVLFMIMVGTALLPPIALLYPAVFTLPLPAILLIMLGGALYVGALLLYLYALKDDEASVVAPLLQMTPVITYGLGYAVLRETLTLAQIIAGLAIIVAAIALTLEFEAGKVRLKIRALLLMLGSSALFSLNALLFKVVAIQSDFWTTLFWEYLGMAAVGVVLLSCVRTYRSQFLARLHAGRQVLFLSASNELINLAGRMAVNFATLLAPLALVSAVGGLQPLFVFAIGMLLTIFLPGIATEKLSRAHVLQKLSTITVMVIAAYYLVR